MAGRAAQDEIDAQWEQSYLRFERVSQSTAEQAREVADAANQEAEELATI